MLADAFTPYVFQGTRSAAHSYFLQIEVMLFCFAFVCALLVASHTSDIPRVLPSQKPDSRKSFTVFLFADSLRTIHSDPWSLLV